MSRRVFHKGYLQTACGNYVNLFRHPFIKSFSTKFSLGLPTGFVVEKGSHQEVFLSFNTTTTTTI